MPSNLYEEYDEYQIWRVKYTQNYMENESSGVMHVLASNAAQAAEMVESYINSPKKELQEWVLSVEWVDYLYLVPPDFTGGQREG